MKNFFGGGGEGEYHHCFRVFVLVEGGRRDYIAGMTRESKRERAKGMYVWIVLYLLILLIHEREGEECWHEGKKHTHTRVH